MAPLTDEEIRKMAKARVGFKTHLAAYVLVNLLLAAIWALTRGDGGPMPSGDGAPRHYWPIWTHLGWGIGLAAHWFFVMGPGQGMMEREERRLRERHGRT